jgi:hypothetical protein
MPNAMQIRYEMAVAKVKKRIDDDIKKKGFASYAEKCVKCAGNCMRVGQRQLAHAVNETPAELENRKVFTLAHAPIEKSTDVFFIQNGMRTRMRWFKISGKNIEFPTPVPVTTEIILDYLWFVDED